MVTTADGHTEYCNEASQEISIMRRLCHPNIVRIIEVIGEAIDLVLGQHCLPLS
jgi:uncharacterized protein with HEPN domain